MTYPKTAVEILEHRPEVVPWSGKFSRLVEDRNPPAWDVTDAVNISSGDQRQAAQAIYMSIDELKRCLDAGLTIGLHTHSHRMLSRLSRKEQYEEIRRPLEFVREKLDIHPDAISYPYGIPGSWSEDTESVMEELGVRYGFTLGRTLYEPGPGTHMKRIPRFDVNDVFDRTAVSPRFESGILSATQPL